MIAPLSIQPKFLGKVKCSLLVPSRRGQKYGLSNQSGRNKDTGQKKVRSQSINKVVAQKVVTASAPTKGSSFASNRTIAKENNGYSTVTYWRRRSL